MRVLEHEHDLSTGAETFDQREEPALHLLNEDRLLALRSAEPDRETQPAGDPLGLAGLAAAVDHVLQPPHRLVGGHVVLDAGDLADDRSHGSEGRRVAVGLRAPADDRDVRLEPGEELIDEP